MSAAHFNPNNRASLLSGLRTGGVRSSSAPHSAAPAGSFNIVPFPQALPTHEDEADQICEMPQRHVYNNRNFPTTAAVDGPNNRFASQQVAPRGLNPLSMPFNMSTPQMQLQMMQLEMMRLQAMQAQQLQTEMLAQQIQQQQQAAAQAAQARERRTSLGFNPPATAGPMTSSFNIGAATNGPMRRPSQADFLRAQLGVGTPPTDHVPMTAAIGGRFGTRSTSLNTHPSIQADQPGTPNPATTIISGGTSLGNASPNNVHNAAAVVTPSKSDAASSWRRGGNNNSVLTPNRVVSSTSRFGQRASPPPALDTSPNAHLGVKFRPLPLRFNAAVSQPLPTVTIDTTDYETDDTHSCESSVNSAKSSPTTPHSTSSHEMPLSPREEASKKLFEGLGISRPVSATPSDQGRNQQAPAIPIITTTPPAPGHRLVSQPTRQPRGPPSGADELGPKNFATRIRRRAIGGLGMLIGARDRREAVEAF